MKNLTLLLILFSLLFFHCKIKEVDPCATLVCQHGGSCIDGSCECPEEWEGDHCENRIQPIALKINVITVSLIPEGDFDSSSLPDVYVAISKGDSINNNEFTTEYHQDVVDGNAYYYSGTELDDVNSFYTISLYDYDELDEDDEMGGIVIKPIDYFPNYLSNINIYDTSISMAISLKIEWVFN